MIMKKLTEDRHKGEENWSFQDENVTFKHDFEYSMLIVKIRNI